LLFECKGTNKRAKSKKKNVFSFSHPSESTFGGAKGTNKQVKNKKIFSFFISNGL